VDDERYEPHRLVHEHVAALEAADRSPNTIKAYLPAIVTFLTSCEGCAVDGDSCHDGRTCSLSRSTNTDKPTNVAPA